MRIAVKKTNSSTQTMMTSLFVTTFPTAAHSLYLRRPLLRQQVNALVTLVYAISLELSSKRCSSSEYMVIPR